MTDLANSGTNQYLTFNLGSEAFALDISQVREVLELSALTHIPRTPSYMRGVINLRGHAVPVVDMRIKFDLERIEDTVNTCVIIVETDFDGRETVLGALVDSVSEVIEIPPSSIEPAPRMGTFAESKCIRGIGRFKEGFIIVLDIRFALSEEELAQLSRHTEPPPARDGSETSRSAMAE